MFKSFYGLTGTPFSPDIPVDKLYETPAYQEMQGRLEYAARNRLFCVITGEVGTGKSTGVRRFAARMNPNSYRILYLSDSDLTPRNFYWETLNQLGCEPRFYRGDAKRQLHRELAGLTEREKKVPVVIVDESHLLPREMLEEARFLLNFRYDSYHPLSLILVGQSQLKEMLKLQIYEAIAQRVDIRFHLPVMTKEQTCAYIRHHLVVAGAAGEIFTSAALAAIYEYCAGVPRKINNLCTASLMAGAGQEQRLIDDHLVQTVIESELEW